jgi:predicted nucleic acid-binding protein
VILDTNALSAVADRQPDVLRALSGMDRLAIPVVVLGEYRFGILQSRRLQAYEQWLAGLLADSIVLQIDSDTASHYSDIRLELKRSGKPIPPNDVWIAALCRQHGSPLISRDRHFDYVQRLKRIAW